MANIEIKQNENGLTRVLVDGQEINHVTRYLLEQDSVSHPILRLETDVLDKDIDLENARVDLSIAHQTLEDAIKLLRFELLKHGAVYNAFCASISSVLKAKEQYMTDSGVLIHAENGSRALAEEILKRIIGEE